MSPASQKSFWEGWAINATSALLCAKHRTVKGADFNLSGIFKYLLWSRSFWFHFVANLLTPIIRSWWSQWSSHGSLSLLFMTHECNSLLNLTLMLESWVGEGRCNGSYYIGEWPFMNPIPTASSCLLVCSAQRSVLCNRKVTISSVEKNPMGGHWQTSILCLWDAHSKAPGLSRSLCW